MRICEWGYKSRFILLAIFVVIVQEQTMVYTQTHALRFGLIIAYYAIDIPFFFITANYVIPYAVLRKNLLVRLPFTLFLTFCGYIVVQNLMDYVLTYVISHRMIWSGLSYHKSIFRASYLLTWAMGYFLTQEGIKRMEKLKDLQIKNLELEAAYYRSKIKPHLIFNTLNFIHGLVEETSEKASRTISLFAKVMRYYLVNSTANVPVINELEQVNDYIELNRARLGDQLCLDIDINTDPAIDKLEIPPQFLLNFVENMFMHGNLLDKEQPAKLSISNEGRMLQMRSWNLKTTARKLNTTGVGMRYVKNQLSRQSTTSYKLSINETAQFYELLFSIEL